MFRLVAIMLLAFGAGPVTAQSFATAAEVKPILEMQKGQWVAVREYNGQDLVYFTAVLAWRCGLESVHYGLNGAAADNPLEMEPCHADTAAPNALVSDTHAIYLTAPLGSVDSVALKLTYDDGSVSETVLARQAVLMP